LIKGQVIYDPANLDTVSIATTLSGLKDAVITDKEIPGLPVLFDCRNKWSTKIEMYNWAIKELLPECNKNYIGLLETSITGMRDFHICEKVFMFDLAPANKEDEIQLVREICRKYKPCTPVLGFSHPKYADTSKGQDFVAMEWAMTKLLSEEGLSLVALDHIPNFSFYKQFPRLKNYYQNVPFVELSDKKYVTFLYSDGDNLGTYGSHRMIMQWEQPERGSVPNGWQVSPVAYDIAPLIMNRWYQEGLATNGNDQFVTGVSGFAYTNPTKIKPEALDVFLTITKEYMDKLDLYAFTILEPNTPVEDLDEIIKKYAEKKIPAGFNWTDASPYLQGQYDNLLFISGQIMYGVGTADAAGPNDKEIKVTIEKLDHYKNKFNYIYCSGWTIDPAIIKKTVDLLPADKYQVVGPNTYINLYKEYLVSKKAKKKSSQDTIISNVVFDIDNTQPGDWLNITANITDKDEIKLAGIVYEINAKQYYRTLYKTDNSDTFAGKLICPEQGTEVKFKIRAVDSAYKITCSDWYTLKK
jgi:hypothetical protein